MEGQQNYLNLRIKKPSQERMQHYLYVWLLFACICSPDTCHTVASCSNLDYFEDSVYGLEKEGKPNDNRSAEKLG